MSLVVSIIIAEGIQCLLCDELVDVRFEPCGHAVVCTKCAERAKKCPSCKVGNSLCVCFSQHLIIFTLIDTSEVIFKAAKKVYYVHRRTNFSYNATMWPQILPKYSHAHTHPFHDYHYKHLKFPQNAP